MDTLLRTARRGHPGLFWTGIAMVALTAGLLVLAVLDQRELLGAPLWFKPLKFAISFASTCWLAWLLGGCRGRPCAGPAGPSSPPR